MVQPAVRSRENFANHLGFGRDHHRPALKIGDGGTGVNTQ